MKIEDLQKFLICPKSNENLYLEDNKFITKDKTHSYPIINGIPRFVESDLYVDSFSFEWNTHNRTQLDSYTGDTSSEAQFIKKTGFTKELLKGKLVLDAGVGAGRYTDVISKWGANVIGVDLSYAVEASYINFKDRVNVSVIQGDIGKLPFAPETFDYIFSIGVLHHTPDTKAYFEKLVPLLKSGGDISIWVYPKEQDYIIRKEWIPFTYKIPDKAFYDWCRWFVPFAQKRLDSPFIGIIRRMFPFSTQGLGLENDILDTFDGYSPRFHGIHSPEEVKQWFLDVGLKDVHFPSDWTTCVRGTK